MNKLKKIGANATPKEITKAIFHYYVTNHLRNAEKDLTTKKTELNDFL